MTDKLITKAASEKMNKEAISSPNFYLDGGEPQEDPELEKFLESRFKGNNAQDILLTKNASTKLSQYNFYRLDVSPDEMSRMNNDKDFQLLALPGSLMEIVFQDSESFISQADEDSLFSLWKESGESSDGYIAVSNEQASKAEKLMNRGYVIDKGGKYQITEKGRKVLVGRILGSQPKYDWDLAKAAAAQSPVQYVIRGTDIELPVIMETKGKDYAIVSADTRVVDRIEKAGLFSEDKVQWASRNLLAIPFSIIEEKDQGASVNPYISDEGQSFGHNAPQSNSPWANKPIGEEVPVMSSFSSSKVFGLLKESSRLGCDSVTDLCTSELNSRGLSVRFVATHDAELEKGLMHSDPLKDNECAVFMFGVNGKTEASNPGFWNKNVDFPIDVAFYNSDGILVSVKQLAANQLDPVFSNHSPIRYVVETKHGWYDENNLKEGSSIWEVLEAPKIMTIPYELKPE